MSKAKKDTDNKKPGRRGQKVPISDVPEVQEYVDLKQELDTFRAEHPDVFMRYEDLVDRVNSALETAEKKVRSMGVTCGPFDLYTSTDVYNADKMFDELGEKLFLECGGFVEQKTEYKVDVKRLEAAIAAGKVPEESIEHFKSTRMAYHVPKKIVT